MLLIAGALVALTLVAVLSVWLLFDPDRMGEQLEVELSHALGMEVKIGQRPRFSLLRGASVALADVEVSRQGQLVATAERAYVQVALLSLLGGKLHPHALELQGPAFSIQRMGPGLFNIYPMESEHGALAELSLRRLQVSNGRLSYRDLASGLEWLFEDCDLELRATHQDESDASGAAFAVAGALQCGRLSQARFAVSDLSVDIHAHRGILELSELSGKALKGQVSGGMTIDFSSSPPVFSLATRLSRFEVGALMALLGPEQVTTGTMDLDLALDARGKTWQHVRDSAAGTLSMAAGELVLVGYDLDSELDGYAATQRFNLVDVGAVLLVGPVGLVASRGYAFSGLLENSDSSTRIVQMVSSWTVQGGVAEARDVAFSTPQNRLALAGGLDFARYRFRDLQVAVLDRDGCAVVEQTITGAFSEPEVKRPNFLVSAVGPLLNLVKRGMRAITAKDCNVFYSGSVPHPQQ
ncbi:MAG: AsmA family protein [Aquimonas sp.]|nr:AsmA family protein [Aquimonas sp.]